MLQPKISYMFKILLPSATLLVSKPHWIKEWRKRQTLSAFTIPDSVLEKNCQW